MKLDTQIYYWAHMLDESLKEDNIGNTYLPKDENEKFKYSDVFTRQLVDKLDTDKAVADFLTSIWPKWQDYFENAIEEEIEVEGIQRDVDDWDMWKISIEDLNNGYDNCITILFDSLFNDFSDDYNGSLKDMFDIIIEKLTESEYDLDRLEDYGHCIWRGSYHTGGYYPDH